MRRIFFWIFIVSLNLSMTSCSSRNVAHYVNDGPRLDLKAFFSGKMKAYGIVEDNSRNIIKRFIADIDAQWSENVGLISENFLYSDGVKENRTWKLVIESDGRVSGSAHDVVGLAKGALSGNAFFFDYVLRVPVKESIYNLSVRDRMFLLDEKTLMARGYMSKWGFPVGEISIVIYKVE